MVRKTMGVVVLKMAEEKIILATVFALIFMLSGIATFIYAPFPIWGKLSVVTVISCILMLILITGDELEKEVN